MQSLIYLLRHGEVDSSRPRRFLGQTNIPLNESGINQAKQVGLALTDISFKQVFSSPLSRAMLTAELVSGRPQSEIQPIAAFQEINLGAWEGLTATDVQKKFPGGYEARGDNIGTFRPQDGESFADVAARTLPALQEIVCKKTGPILIVAHAGVNRALLASVQHTPLDQLLTIPQNYCGVNILASTNKVLSVLEINRIFYS